MRVGGEMKVRMGSEMSRFAISMANRVRLPAFQPWRLGGIRLPKPLAALAGRIPRRIRWRPGSKIALIDAWLRNRPYQWRLGPTLIAELLTDALGVQVFKQEVYKVLKSWNHTRKKISIVPARSRPAERRAHLNALGGMWTRDDKVRCCSWTRWHCTHRRLLITSQFVFVDEKTWHRGEVKERVNEYGYAERGVCVPFRCVAQPLGPLI